jgi:predicted  nucleic acid-binding Zn-ribbon protein
MVKDEGEIIQSAAKRVGIPEQNYFRWKKALAPLLAKEEETHAYTPLRTSPSKEIGDLKEELDRAKNKLWEMMLKIDKLEEENQKLREEIARLKGQKQQ